ncbi:MAG: hypothetical protein J6U23_02365 [Clostridiales bacterium]|nr:hypothetical protein [Clostridiales bacterium]
MELTDRNVFFQKQLNKFPAIFHVDGEKKRIGYFIYFVLSIGLLALPVIWEIAKSKSEWNVWKMIYIMVFGFGWFVVFNYYCLKNNHNNWLFWGFGGALVSYVHGVFFGQLLYTAFSTSLFFHLIILCGWVTLVAYIRAKAMDAACREYAMQNRVLAEESRIDFFDGEAKKEKVVEVPDEKTFIDDKPNWNSKVVLGASKIFCPKCGFGLVPGEDMCHVCGTKVIEKQKTA